LPKQPASKPRRRSAISSWGVGIGAKNSRDPAPGRILRRGLCFSPRDHRASRVDHRLGRNVAVAKDTLTITDNRTGKSYEVPIAEGTIKAVDLRNVKVDDADFGLMTYDPAFMNTAACRSAITYIDGDNGILRYRGYPIEQLAERSSFLEVAYLLAEGELPTQAQLDKWTNDIRYHTYVHTNIIKFLEGFRYDAHPMGMMVGTVAALSTFYPDAKDIGAPANRYVQRIRLLAKFPTIAAFIFRHSRGLPYEFPRNDLDYIGNYVNMMFSIGGRHQPNKVLQRALEILLILHADHEQNCSTSAVRSVGSSHVDPFSAISAGVAALYGPLHGGANEAVLEMLDEIGDKKSIPAFIEKVKQGEGRLMGFGHRVYKSYDPRAKLIKKTADDVFAQTGLNPKLEIALELERIALEDEYFIKRKLYPNVDFYSGLIYQAMGYPTDYFTVLFAVGRLPGWLAQWEEMLKDKDQKIARPRQIYTGPEQREFVEIGNRG
jgi:citrate synthase